MHTTTPTRRTPIVFVAAKRQPELHALGRALRELRARRDLSQEGLGHACNTHRNYIGAIERGEINPTFRVLLRLSRGLDLPLTEIVEVYERQLAPWTTPDDGPTGGASTGTRDVSPTLASHRMGIAAPSVKRL